MGRLRLRENELRASRLPELCMVCGEPAETHVKKNFSWFPPWVSVTILLGLIPYVIIAAILTKRMSVGVTLCARHRGHFWKRTLVIWLALLGWLALSVAAFVIAAALAPKNGPGGGEEFGFAWLAFTLGLIAAIIVIAIAQNTAIRPKEITDRDITLIHVDDRFIDEIERMREERRRLRDEDDYEARRLPRRPTPGAVPDVERVDDRPRPKDAFRAEPREEA
jgi:hypothetical protein